MMYIDELYYLNAFPLSVYSNQQAFLLENVPCNNASCEGAHRMFKVVWELTGLNQIRDAMVATFFDIYEDVSSELLCVLGSDSRHLVSLSLYPVRAENVHEIKKADFFFKESLF